MKRQAAHFEDLLLGLPRGKVWPVTEEGLRKIAKIGPWSQQVAVWSTPTTPQVA